MSATAPRHRVRFFPTTRVGRGAGVIFALAGVLVLARLAHVPPLNYLVVLIAVALSGVAALVAVLLRERSAGVWVILVVGLLAAALLLLETINPPS